MPKVSRAYATDQDTPEWPVNRHAEAVVLGNALQDWRTLREQLGPDLFCDKSNQRILRVMRELDERGEPVDSTTVCEQLQRSGLKEGDISLLTQLGDVPVLGSGLDPYIRTLDKTRRLRTLAKGAQEIATEACIEGADLRHLHDRYEKLGTVFQSDEALPSTIPAWPSPLGEDAYHGVAGELVRLIEPHTEADPMALLLQFLIGWGSLIGRGPYMLAEADRHYTNEYGVLVGVSSIGRKGSAWGRIRSVFESVDPDWLQRRLLYGVGSGERLVDMAAETDHRVLIHEGELARLLAIVNREASTISSNIRMAWDQGILEINSRQKEAHAAGAHVSMIGHITKDELAKKMSDTELTNGFANRILWACIKRCKSLPHGGGHNRRRHAHPSETE